MAVTCGLSGRAAESNHQQGGTDTSHCASCDSRFHVARNRYVCKACLRVVCSRCSPFRKAVDLNTGVIKAGDNHDIVFRVCRDCKERGHGKRPILTTKAAKKAQYDALMKAQYRRNSIVTRSSGSGSGNSGHRSAGSGRTKSTRASSYEKGYGRGSLKSLAVGSRSNESISLNREDYYCATPGRTFQSICVPVETPKKSNTIDFSDELLRQRPSALDIAEQ